MTKKACHGMKASVENAKSLVWCVVKEGLQGCSYRDLSSVQCLEEMKGDKARPREIEGSKVLTSEGKTSFVSLYFGSVLTEFSTVILGLRLSKQIDVKAMLFSSHARQVSAEVAVTVVA